MNKADKIIKVSEWMSKQGYDRRFTKDVAPVIVDFIADDILKGFADVIPVVFQPEHDEIQKAAVKYITEQFKHITDATEFKFEVIKFGLSFKYMLRYIKEMAEKQ